MSDTNVDPQRSKRKRKASKYLDPSIYATHQPSEIKPRACNPRKKSKSTRGRTRSAETATEQPYEQRTPASAPTDLVVERIISRRFVHGYAEYKCRWRGYTREDDTWEPLHCLLDSVAVEKVYFYERRLAHYPRGARLEVTRMNVLGGSSFRQNAKPGVLNSLLVRQVGWCEWNFLSELNV